MLKNSFINLIYFIVISGIILAPVYAESLYFSMIEQATISDKLLAKTQQQLEECKPIIIQKLTLVPFHKRSEQVSKIDSFCTLCHMSLPHQENIRLRSFLNMHTRYIACETCHFEAKDLNYHWSPLSNKDKHQNAKLQPHPMAKIVPFFQAKPITGLPTHPFFQQVKEQWENLSLSDQAKLKAKIHQPLTEKGVTCTKCHSDEQSFLNLKQLGASESQQRAIEQNKIAKFLMRKQNDTIKHIRLIELW